MLDTTQALPKELESIAYVRFQDCDPFQHLNNARYIDYFLNAREDQLIKFYDFSIFQYTKEANAGWVVTKTQIAYLYPATGRSHHQDSPDPDVRIGDCGRGRYAR